MAHAINLYDPEVRRDPYPTYAALREQPAQQVEPMGVWVISRYDDVQYALKHPELFSSAAFSAIFKPAWLPNNPLSDSLVVKDGPEHDKLRALISRAFTPKNIAKLEPRIRAIAGELADAMRGHAQLDFVAAFAVPLSARVIAEVIGLDPALHERFGVWANLSVPPVEPPAEIADGIRRTIAEMQHYLEEVVASRRAQPSDDIVSALLAAELDGERLSHAEIISFLFLLLLAGVETSRHLLANTMLNFLTTDEFARLREDRSAVPGFVEEVLRHDTAVHAVQRITLQDVEISGATIPAGSLVSLLIGATGRDPEHTTDPDRFDHSRANTGLLSFGHGAHYCIGAALARLEAKVGIEVLLDRFVGLERGDGELQWNLNMQVRGPLQIPVRLSPA